MKTTLMDVWKLWAMFWRSVRTDESWMGYLFRNGMLVLLVVVVLGFCNRAGAAEREPVVDWQDPKSIVSFFGRIGFEKLEDPNYVLHERCERREMAVGAAKHTIQSVGIWWDHKRWMAWNMCASDATIPEHAAREQCARVGLKFACVDRAKVYCEMEVI